MNPRAWREAAGLTNESLAKKLKLSKRSVIRYLNGDREWPSGLWVKLKKLAGNAITDADLPRRKSA